MQTLGTEWGRTLAPDLWVNAWCRSIVGLKRVVADDVRFDNEVAAVRALGGMVFEVRRLGIVRPAAAHASAAGVVADVMLLNDHDPLALTAYLDALL